MLKNNLPFYVPLTVGLDSDGSDSEKMPAKWEALIGNAHQAILDHLVAGVSRGFDAAVTVAQLDPLPHPEMQTLPVSIQFQPHYNDNLQLSDLRSWVNDPDSLFTRALKLNLSPGAYRLSGRWVSPIGCTTSDHRLRRRMGLSTGLLIILQSTHKTRLIMAAFLSPKYESSFLKQIVHLPCFLRHVQKCLDFALEGGFNLAPPVPTAYPLSQAERALLPLLLTPLSERQIAQQVSRSPNTIHCHVRSIYRKLRISTREELCALMKQHK